MCVICARARACVCVCVSVCEGGKGEKGTRDRARVIYLKELNVLNE